MYEQITEWKGMRQAMQEGRNGALKGAIEGGRDEEGRAAGTEDGGARVIGKNEEGRRWLPLLLWSTQAMEEEGGGGGGRAGGRQTLG